MIVVNLNRSYPTWVRTFAAAAPENLHQVKVAQFGGLRDVCAGEWWQLTDATIAANMQQDNLLVGCYSGQVVGAWHIDGHRQNPSNGRVTFALKPAYDFAGMLGAAQPGGPWARGEARGWRVLDDPAYLTKYQAKPSAAIWKYNTAEVAMYQARNLTREAVPSQPVTQPAEVTFRWPHTGDISLRWTSSGLLEIHLDEDIRIRTVRRQPVKRRRSPRRTN